MSEVIPGARSPLAAPTKAFLAYLQKHPELRMRIRADVNCTVAYAGTFTDGAAWQRLKRRQWSNPVGNDFQMLPDVLSKIDCDRPLYEKVGVLTPPGIRTLLDFVDFLAGSERYPVGKVPPEDGFVIWRALSGIFMSNARGRVRLMIADVPVPSQKVFFRTEIFVLERNPNIDVFAQGAIQLIRAQLKAGVLKGSIELM